MLELSPQNKTDFIDLKDLTHATLEGQGMFDVLMRVNKLHLEQEFKQQRIKGSEYATVYLGSLDTVLRTSLEFVLQRNKIDQETRLLEKQIELAQVELDKGLASIALINQQKANALAEWQVITNTALKVTEETAMVVQQKANLVDALLTSAKERLKTDQEIANLVLQGLQVTAQTDMVTQQKLNLIDELTTATKQRLKLDAEVALLTQKKLTETAQIDPTGVSVSSVIGKQNSLYQAQAEGFVRDAEQKATEILVKTWNVRRTTDEATVADGTNKLNDATIGAAVTKLLAGIGLGV
jgi:hypothetical protein